MSVGVISFLNNTYITDGDKNFVISLKKIDKYLKKEMTEDIRLSITNCKSVLSVIDKDDTILIKVLFPEELNNLKELFLDSKYSEFSEDNKTDILDYHFTYSELNDYIKIGYILYKNEILKNVMAKELQIKSSEIPRDMELDSLVNIENETYSEVTI